MVLSLALAAKGILNAQCRRLLFARSRGTILRILLSKIFPGIRYSIFLYLIVFIVFSFLGYNGLFKRRLGTKSDGCAIFWRTDRFDLLQSDSMDFQVADTILDRDNVALFVVLVPKIRFQQETTNGANVIIANTHLLFNPGRGDIKLCQLAMTLARVQKVRIRPSVKLSGIQSNIAFCAVYFFIRYEHHIIAKPHYSFQWHSG